MNPILKFSINSKFPLDIYDQGGNVTDLTDHLGSEVVKYRYDAFGGLFTAAWTPYNYQGLTGKNYDPKAGLMNYSARWYSPDKGRFTSRDNWTGDVFLPQTLNPFAYVLNNPVKYNDPTDHCIPDPYDEENCYFPPRDDDDGSSDDGSCGYSFGQ